MLHFYIVFLIVLLRFLIVFGSSLRRFLIFCGSFFEYIFQDLTHLNKKNVSNKKLTTFANPAILTFDPEWKYRQKVKYPKVLPYLPHLPYLLLPPLPVVNQQFVNEKCKYNENKNNLLIKNIPKGSGICKCHRSEN